jgi:hypothetical protein
MKLIFLGIPGMLVYEGFDINRRPISCRKGDWVEVSQEKGDRLLQDFPGAWGKEEVVQGAKEPVVEVPPIPDLLGAPMPLDKKPVLRKKHGR